jgi:hypothetical protein
MTNPSAGEPRNGAAAVTAVALVIAVAAGALAGIGLHKRSHDADVAEGSTGQSASAVAATARTVIADAGQYAVDYTSFNYLTLGQDRANTAKNFTPAFARSYITESKATAPFVRKAKAVAVSNVDAAALASLDVAHNAASVIVAMSITTKNVKSPNGALTYYRFEIPLVRQSDGTWLASNIKPV